MIFRTEIDIPKAAFELTHQDFIAMIGSCFAENIGASLSRYRFHTAINPHGIVFNPASVAIAIEDVIENKKYTADNLILHNGIYSSLNHHGRFSHESKEIVCDKINTSISNFHKQLSKAKVLFVTFGSAHAYRHISTNQIVANCHKLPQENFRKELITHEEIMNKWHSVIEKLRHFNSDLKIVFTVSPVRYWRDGAQENQLSKSHLLIACHQLKQAFREVYYFPSYELVIDDLRDYRFFKEDMLHPNEQAIRYVWEKFCKWCMSSKTEQVLKELEPHIRFAEHRPLHNDNGNYNNLIAEKEKIIAEIISKSN